MIRGMARRRDRRNGPSSSPSRSTTSSVQPCERGLLEPPGHGFCEPAATGRARALAQAGHRLRLVEVVVRQHDAGDPAALLRRLPNTLDVAGSAGPGSITHAGLPISHVFVPERVIGPAFDARTSVTPSGTRSVTSGHAAQYAVPILSDR